ncbi:MAG: hypothetical protein ACFBSD_04130 [Paracoccaceae bacterium]
MNRPKNFTPPRPFRPNRKVPRCGVGAAVALVRIEFERLRHDRDIARLGDRIQASQNALHELDRRSAELCDAIGAIRWAGR